MRLAGFAAIGLSMALGLTGCLGFGDDEAPPQTSLSTAQTTRGGRISTTDAGASGMQRVAPDPKAGPPQAPVKPGPVVFTNTQQPPAALPTLPGAAPVASPAASAATSPAAAPGAPPPRPQLAAIPAGVDPAAPGVPMLDVYRKEKFAALMTRIDDVYAERSAQLALEYTQDGAQRPWSNPDTGTTGTIAPVRTFQRGGTYCREYAHTIEVRQRGSTDVKGKGQAAGRMSCREASGKWKFLP